MKVDGGKFGYIVNRQSYYNGLVETLNKADQHMKSVASSALEL